jgi:3-dehydroquinate dehydratase-2
MLGTREKDVYGGVTLSDICNVLEVLGRDLGAQLTFYQSNVEGELVNAIQQAKAEEIEGIVINPGAYTHTSVAIRDALLAVQIPFVEIHISNVYSRESFRHTSYLSDLAAGVVIGFGPAGYELALTGLLKKLRTPK